MVRSVVAMVVGTLFEIEKRKRKRKTNVLLGRAKLLNSKLGLPFWAGLQLKLSHYDQIGLGSCNVKRTSGAVFVPKLQAGMARCQTHDAERDQSDT